MNRTKQRLSLVNNSAYFRTPPLPCNNNYCTCTCLPSKSTVSSENCRAKSVEKYPGDGNHYIMPIEKHVIVVCSMPAMLYILAKIIKRVFPLSFSVYDDFRGWLFFFSSSSSFSSSFHRRSRYIYLCAQKMFNRL